jgi:hypothetical protein
VTCDLYSQLQCRCVAMDPYGSFNNYQDVIFDVGHHVFVMFPKGDKAVGIIMGGSRFYGKPVNPDLGLHLTRRFNEVEESFTKAGSYEVVSDDGPNFKLKKKSIVLDDASGDNITIDKASKQITINCGDWNVKVEKACNIIVGGAANIQAQSVTVKASADAQVTAGGKVSVNAGGDAQVTASGNATINGKEVDLNGKTGMVVTNMTYPFCYVSGIPIIGVPTVKAG